MQQQPSKSFESSLHDIVYSIDTGTGLKIIRTLLYVLVVLALMMVYTATQFGGLNNEESMDYAQLGRNISSQGLMTKCVRPITIAKVSERMPGSKGAVMTHPDMIHPPLYPLMLSAGFRFFEGVGLDPFHIDTGARVMPAEQWVVIPMNHFFVLMSGLVIFSLGKRLFTRDVAFWSMTIYYCSSLVWKDSLQGVGLPIVSFFILSAFRSMVVTMQNRRDRLPKVKWILPFLGSILFSVLAFYTRYISIVIIPGLILFAWLAAGRFRGGTRYAVIFIVLYSLMISPWLYRNYKLTGNPAGMALQTALAESPGFPEKSYDRTLKPDFTLKVMSASLKQKWVSNYKNEYASLLPGMGGGFLMAFFMVTFFYHFIRPQVNFLRWGVLLSLLSLVVVAGFFSDSSMALVHVFWPFALLYGYSFFVILMNRLDMGVQLYTNGLKALVFLISFIPFTLALMPPQNKYPYPPYYAPLVSYVSEMLNERELMVTDMPWATAWYGDRSSVLLPQNVDDFYEIYDYLQYASGVYITTITKNKPFVKDLVDGPEKSWANIMMGHLPRDFPLKYMRPLNRQDQIFICDRDRWNEGGAAEVAQ